MGHAGPVDVTADLQARASAADVFQWVDELSLYPRWLDLVRVYTLDRPASEAYHNLGTNGTAGYWWRSVPA